MGGGGTESLPFKEPAENEDLAIASLYKQFSIQYIAAVRPPYSIVHRI